MGSTGPDGLGGHRGHPKVVKSSKASYDIDGREGCGQCLRSEGGHLLALTMCVN